ncbi:hypothetical protein LAD12857_01080 [Lacrimispora amygdalina]|uniref:Zinc ribbon domain-containing protein n=1 Tax=Lacrimispora amygdalina TaxID=253257 RepID=A0ABQ5M0P0_9FIRM
MKKVNSIFYGSYIIGLGLLFLIPIPLLLYITKRYFCSIFLSYAIGASIVIGTIVECAFGILLIIELHQDEKIQKYCQNHRNIKIKLEEGKYECQNCGNRMVKEQDEECSICGIKYVENEIKTIQEILRM